MHVSTELGFRSWSHLPSGFRWLLGLIVLGAGYAAFSGDEERPPTSGDLPAAGIQSAAGVIADSSEERDAEQKAVDEASAQEANAWIDPQALPDLAREAESCRARVEQARALPAFPGAPRLEARRAQVLARGKAEPVVFVEEPTYRDKGTRGIEIHRKRLQAAQFVRDATIELLRQYRGYPNELRQLFLRDGYLYLDDAAAARELTTRLELAQLFEEKELIIERGSERLAVEKTDGSYRYVGGRDAGQPATLLLFDRVWVKGQDPGRSLHLDVREFATREGTDGMRFDHLGERSVVVELRYEDEWVTALLDRDGPRLDMNCLLVEPDDVARVGRARDRAFRRAQIVRSIQSAIIDQVRAGLPFDEPKTERGQQDGELRRRWDEAYLSGKTSYRFNGDKYRVFDERGKPLTPQVCIDFVTETLERASGMHFAPQGEKPHKVLGALDFDEILSGFRRQESALRTYAKENPDRLAILDFPESSWVRYEDVGKFFKTLESNRDEMRAGDVVIIRGRAAWDYYHELHTHTFFVYETDPVTGMPLLLAGNSGKPRIVTWDSEMLRAPRRSIQHRIRPNMEWLYDRVILREPLRGERWAAPLSVNQD